MTRYGALHRFTKRADISHISRSNMLCYKIHQKWWQRFIPIDAVRYMVHVPLPNITHAFYMIGLHSDINGEDLESLLKRSLTSKCVVVFYEEAYTPGAVRTHLTVGFYNRRDAVNFKLCVGIA